MLERRPALVASKLPCSGRRGRRRFKTGTFRTASPLEGRSPEVDTAGVAAAACRALQTQTLDPIFLGHIMPGIEGIAPPQGDPATTTIPLVICSSNEDAASIAEARNQGMPPKPPAPEPLAHLLAALAIGARQNPHDASLAAAEAAAADVTALHASKF